MKKLKVIMCKGLPASGKSTWAQDYVLANPDTVRINNDGLQRMVFCEQFGKGRTKSRITEDMRALLLDAAASNYQNIVIDNTNLDPKKEVEYRALVDTWNTQSTDYQWEFIIKDFTNVSVAECIRRNRLRPHPVPDKVIYNMYNAHLKPVNPPVLPQDESLPKAIIVDLDGTLALMGDRGPFEQHKVYGDTVNYPVFQIVSAFIEHTAIIFLTGREEACRTDTVKWLMDKCVLHPTRYTLYMKKDGDKRADTETKAEVFNNLIKPNFHVLFCIDDRTRVTQMWRDLGLTCFQCADGFY